MNSLFSLVSSNNDVSLADLEDAVLDGASDDGESAADAPVSEE